eukprot:CAMPEP_0168377792 /NCGR_PEP_ID=MMETSP0228-20121227/11005_1 /TAXON_ID=133427 /ORGANISM="Protoceratium reticulatum, Strain CCCM 535 (=CCMP 1889)" /LENGTH=820 /DNA_ID=CAMNT_0008390793 /DNA_START=1 /DNA_END=2460 /DNA_ORIENTATION=-
MAPAGADVGVTPGPCMRVDIPRAALAHFTQPEVHISLESAARLLGFPGAVELRKFATPHLKQFEDAEPLGAQLGALALQRLILVCGAKTAAARRLLDDLAAGWRIPSGRSEVVSLPAYPVLDGAGIGRWPSCAPEAVGMERAPFERLRQYINWRTRMRHFAGIACGVVRNGQLTFYQESGYVDAEAKVKMTGDTIVRLFSMTKCLVAAAFMTFVEVPSSGIDLDDPVCKYIPAFAEMSVLPKRGQKENQPCEKPITLRQLLTHTSGIGYGATLDDPWPPAKGSYYKIYEDICERVRSGSVTSLEEWCNVLARVPLKGQPGHCWDYSYSLDVLGRVLEVVAGKPLDVVVQERICGPLKMRDTTFVIPPEKASRIGPWYKSVEVEGKPNLAHRLEVVDKGGEQSGWVGANASRILSGGGTVEVPLAMKGGMVSTFNDYLRFLLMLRNFGELDGVRVLRRETVQHMICNHIPAACNGKRKVFVFDKPGLGYSCLGQIQAHHPGQDKGTVPGEYGWGGLAGPAWTIDPRSDLIVLSMTQTAFVLDHEEYIRYAARRAIHQHIFGSVAAPAKATSFSPECFDVVRPKPSPEPSSAEEQAAMDKEFEEEHTVNARTRVPGAKERAICPGPRLDRHPSGDDSGEGSGAEDGEAPAAKRRRSNGGSAGPMPKADKAALPAASPPAKRSSSTPTNSQQTPTNAIASPGRVATAPSPGKSPTAYDRQDLLFTRVCVRAPEVGEEQQASLQKARITAIEGDQVEVITEGNYSTMNVSLRDVSAIDESHLGTSLVQTAGPKDFGFLMTPERGSGDFGAAEQGSKAAGQADGQ